jgi:hypothetical protein
MTMLYPDVVKPIMDGQELKGWGGKSTKRNNLENWLGVWI